MQFKVRFVLAGLAALLVLALIAAVSASAGPGPFWHQRKAGEKNNGVKISELAPMKFQGKGGVLQIAFNPDITCNEAQIEGVIYNNSLQGQGKVNVTYEKCKTTLSNCVVNEPIQMSWNMHLMWKWNQSKKELEGQKRKELGQVPVDMFYSGEIQEGTKALNESASFLSIGLKNDGSGECKREGEPIVIRGYDSAEITPEGTEHWKSNYNLRFRPKQQWQTFWNGSEQLGLITHLMEGPLFVFFANQDEIGPFLTQGDEHREIAIFEN